MGIVVGLTGQSGAGKTTVSRMLTQRGYSVIDADVVARQVVEKGKQCLMDLVLEFGAGILEADGSLNRRKLGQIVFGDKQKRKTLNQIIHPYIQKEIFSQARACHDKGEDIVFLDAPTLIESGSHRFCDMVVSVIAPEQVRLERLLARDAEYTQEELKKRLAAQYGDDFYIGKSAFLIRNSGDLTELRVSVVEMLEMAERCLKGLQNGGS